MRPSPIVLLLASVTAGCATVPRLGPAPQLRTPASLASTQTLPEAGTARWPDDRWWTGFGDPQLAALIDEGLANAPDLAQAQARIRSADALAQQAGAAFGPTLTVDSQIGAARQSENLGIPPAFVPKGILDTGRVTATAQYSFDLFGRNRANLRSALGDARAAAIEAQQVRLQISTQIASAYADLARLFAERDVAQAAVAARRATSVLTAQRVAVGVDNLGAQAQADSRVPQAEADLSRVDEAIALTRDRIAALVGAGPDRGLRIAAPRLSAPPTGVPTSAGIDLVGRRPDLVAARLRAEAAGDRIKVARADFYPNIGLGLVVGLQSLGLGKLFSLGSSYGNGGLAFSLPVFDGGRLQGRYRGARADYDAAVGRYDATLVTALREAADAVASIAAADAQAAQLRRAVASAEQASRVATLRYRGGLSSQLPVLTTDDTLLAVRRAAVDADARRLALEIDLIRALGGGFRDPALAQRTP